MLRGFQPNTNERKASFFKIVLLLLLLLFLSCKKMLLQNVTYGTKTSSLVFICCSAVRLFYCENWISLSKSHFGSHSRKPELISAKTKSGAATDTATDTDSHVQHALSSATNRCGLNSGIVATIASHTLKRDAPCRPIRNGSQSWAQTTGLRTVSCRRQREGSVDWLMEGRPLHHGTHSRKCSETAHCEAAFRSPLA